MRDLPERLRSTSRLFRPLAGVVCALLTLSFVAAFPSTIAAQTITGRLLDSESNSAIPLGLVMMFTVTGDSIGATVADEVGRFSISSPEPGSFLLRAVALGYRETGAGVFDLGPDGSMTVEYRLPPEPLALEEIVVSLDRPVVMHHLVRNGFVRRLQRGLGLFVTPYDIERSPARSTESLLEGLPGVRIGMARENVGGVGIPRPDIGQTIEIGTPRGWCRPTVYVDGRWLFYDPDGSFTLSSAVDLQAIEAIEVYRRLAEVPVEYSVRPGTCGVIVAWSKVGPAPGQRPLLSRAGRPRRLPIIETRGPPPESGETIRVEIQEEIAASLGFRSPYQGEFLGSGEQGLVVTDPLTGRAVVVPPEGIGQLQVQRARAPGWAYVRGVAAGAAFGLGAWAGLTYLCAWSNCNESIERPWLPAAIGGVAVGFLVRRLGPGTRWVSTSLPQITATPDGPAFGWSLPARSP